MKPSKLADNDERIGVLYHGYPKVGKTTAAAHMTKLGSVVYIAAEAGLKRRALQRAGLTKTELDRLNVVRPEKYQDLDDLFWALKASKKPPVGLVWDSATITQQWTMDEIGEDKVARKKAKNRDAEVEPFPYNQDDWNRGNERIRRLIRRYTDLPMHFAVTAFTQFEEEDKEGTETNMYVPAVTPGVRTALGGYVDVIVYLMVKEVNEEPQYQGYCRSNDRYLAGDRFGVLPRVLINPTFDRVLAYVRGELTVKTDDVQQAAIAAAKKRKGSK